MIKTYSMAIHKNVYCSPHTQVKEMASKDGANKVLISTELMDKVEALFKELRCSKYIIASGYRTSEHDKKVGGDGKGQHTLGTALDGTFYDVTGKIIPAKIVCCVAQDLGFTGIANINSKHREVHLDVRTGKKWYGDETKGTNTVTSDFYSYFKVTKEQVAKYTGKSVINYFPKYEGGSVSIIDALKVLGINSAFTYRTKIAKANNIKCYVGTGAQNKTMLTLLKSGKLVRP